MSAISQYFAEVHGMLERIENSEVAAMMQVAKLFADTIECGNSIFVTGSNHSNIFAQEVFYRAGGFMLMNPLFLPGMNVQEFPPTRTSKLERLSGLAEATLSESPIRKGDVLVIASISGRNAVPVESALYAVEHGIKVVALTSMEYSGNVTSRHSSGKLLHQIADFVLDVHCPTGDAVLAIPGLPVKTAAVSTIGGVTIMHATISKTLEILIERGITPPVFMSGNLDEGDEHNKRMLATFASQIHYLR